MSGDASNVSEVLDAAVAHHRAGRLPQAEQLYRQVLAREPAHALAWHHLGVSHSQRGDFAVAAQCICRAIELTGDVAPFHANLGAAYHGLGRLDDALAAFRRAIELAPQLAEAHQALANVLLAKGMHREAEASYRAAIAIKPDLATAHCNLGNALGAQKRSAEAEACYRRAVEVAPDFAEAHSNLGASLYSQDRLDEAAASYQRAIECRPTFDQAHNNLGLVLQRQGRIEQAAECYRRALALNPRSAEAHANLATLLHDEGSLEAAIAEYRRSIELDPQVATVHNNLGTALQQRGSLDEAIGCYRRAVALDPNSAVAQANLAKPMRERGDLLEAVRCYRRALEIHPGYVAARGALVYELAHICQWDDIEEQSRRVAAEFDADAREASDDPMQPFTMLSLPTVSTAAQQLRCARAWADYWVRPAMVRERANVGSASRPRSDRITIGYLSADLYSHAIAVLAAELFEKHDRHRFQVFAYSYGRDDQSPMRARLEKGFDRFVDLRALSHVEAARRIVEDRVDILVDLTGYTKEARTRILAFRPAPVQVNFLGYVGTLGTPLVDYIVVDDFVVPPAMQPWYVEKLVHLPGTYMVNDSQRAIAAVTPSRRDCGLPERGTVFCSFNNNYKITPAMFSVWMRILAAVPDSVLWLFAGNRFAPANLRREARARGIAPERLVFAPHAPLANHLARHRLADLFLDTFPYNAHTTASDALWSGCPLVTLAGETFQTRVAGSLLRALGLEELITWTVDEYEALAVRLATHPDELVSIRARLAAAHHASGVFDAEQFARHLEQAFATMHERHCAGLPPASFRVDPR